MSRKPVLPTRCDWAQLKPPLLQAGARSTADPTLYQPDPVVATLGPGQDLPAYIQRVKALSGVRYAEPDALSGIS